MILPWMLYAILVSLLLGLAARSLEATVQQRGWPTRWLWIGSLFGSAAIPAVAALAVSQRTEPLPGGAPPGSATPSVAGIPSPIEWFGGGEIGEVAVVIRSFDPDPWLLGAWAVASVLLLVGVAIQYCRLWLRSRQWVRRSVDGHNVWISRDTGPAVVGFFPGRIVLPEWVLEKDEKTRAMVLAHEAEHLQRGDARLLLGAYLLTAVAWWNVPLWWQCRRLHQAVEVDCDRRVLARGVNPRAYSQLLIDVSERGTAYRFVVAALSESPSFLERRIRHMCASVPTYWWPRAVGSTILASSLVLVACQVDRPDTSPVPSTGATYTLGDEGMVPRSEARPASSAGFAPANDEPAMRPLLREAVRRFYPEFLTDEVEGGQVSLYFLADARGAIVRTALDTQRTAGSIQVPIAEHLGIDSEISRREVQGMGVQLFAPGELGPSHIGAYFAVLSPRPGEENAPPTDIFLFLEGTGFPSERVLRAAVERHHPQVLARGVDPEQRLWFIVSDQQEVVRTGQMPSMNSREAQAYLEAEFPGIQIRRVVFSSGVRADNGFVRLAWVQLTPDSPLP